MVPDVLRAALSELRAHLEGAFPGRIERVVLFGSWARGEANEDSDVDVLVLLRGGSFAERARALDIGALVGLDHGLALAPVVLDPGEWEDMVRRERRFSREIVREGADV